MAVRILASQMFLSDMAGRLRNGRTYHSKRVGWLELDATLAKEPGGRWCSVNSRGWRVIFTMLEVK